MVVDQQHCCSGEEGATPRRSLLAYPRQNSLLLFDGRLGHGVLNTLRGGARMTLLINWWHHKPKVKPPSAAEAACGTCRTQAMHQVLPDVNKSTAMSCVGCCCAIAKMQPLHGSV